jgi:hypothetical protein
MDGLTGFLYFSDLATTPKPMILLAKRDHEIWIFLVIILVVASIPLLAAFVFPRWRLNWGRGGKVPMSKRGKIVMGLYTVFFGLSVSLTSLVGSELSEAINLLFILLMMVAMYPVYSRDRREFENSNRELPHQ